MASTPWWACRKSGVEIITASVTLASYISSLLRNARGFAPTTFSIPATPSSRRRFQMSETATISKLRSLPTLPNAGRRAWRKRSENPTIPTRTRSFAPRIFAYRAAGSAAAVAAATFTSSRRGIFVLCSDISPPGSRMRATAGGVEPVQRAAHIGERLFHPRQRVVDVDFVLQVDEALNAREQRRGGVRGDQRHTGGPGVREVFLHVRIAVLVERDHSTAHDLQTRTLVVAPGRGQLFRRQLVRQVHGLEIDEGCAERLHHLDRLVAGEFSE